MGTPTLDGHLLNQAGAGDPAAFGRLVHELGPELVPRIRSMVGPALTARVEPEDVFQESAMVAMRSMDALRSRDVRGFRAWFLGIARNRIFQIHNRARARLRPRRNTTVPFALLACLDPSDLAEASHDPEPRAADGAEPTAGPLRNRRAEQRLSLVLHDVMGSHWGTLAFILNRCSGDAARLVHRRARDTEQLAFG